VSANFFRALAFASLLVLISAGLSQAQSNVGPIVGPETPAQDESRIRMEKDMAKKANQQRQAELKRDAEKLLKVATELKAYVDKTNENLLSIEVVSKAEEIEKLAHSVREKMRGAN
jgi:membrane protein involved in colicin uptake